MEYVTFGGTGLSVSRMGLGGIPIQKTDAAAVRRLLERLAAEGVNYIDTARGYTVSEALLGEALEGMRERFTLATKSMARTREAMARDIETSLANLRTERVELYQVHNPSAADLDVVTGPGGALEALLEAKRAGKVLHIGLTAHTPAVLERAISLPWVESVMFPYNIVETQGAELLRRAREKGLAVVCMKPLAGGAIENARLAMRFLRQNDDLTVVIPGMYDVREAEENLAAFADASPLTDAENAEIARIREALGTQFCRRCNYCQPCTTGIGISNVFVFEGYLKRYGLGGWALDRYRALGKGPEACVGCGACEKRCPYGLPIREMLRQSAKTFAEYERTLAEGDAAR